jgi:hypothetical protein
MNTHLRRCTLLLILLLAPAARAGTWFVDVARTTGADDGTSWADAFQGADGLQDALALAQPGDQIWVAQGTYLPTTTGSRLSSFLLRSGIAIYGGFDGGEVTLAERDVLANPTILSGDLLGDDASGGSNAENSFHVVNGNGADATGVLDGFTVRAGHANDPTSNRDRGAGLICLGSLNKSTVRNCRFVANTAIFGGGAGYLNSGAAPTFLDCTFEDNVGGSFGGAFDMANSVKAVFRRCTFVGNRAARAGGVEIFGTSAVELYECLFTGNTATGSGGGGGIWISGSAPRIVNCTVIGNTATTSAFAGIQVTSGTPHIANCIVASNFGAAGQDAVGSQINPATLDVTYSLSNVAYAGTGNLTGTPVYENCGPHPFALGAGSPGVDAGNNAEVSAGSLTDLAGAPRFFDTPAVPDSGPGLAPLVDLGAYETGFDCNANGVNDLCDIALGTSGDLDGDGLPDECECSGGTPPSSYCTAKLNSQGCLPVISASGIASAAGALPFPIRANAVINQTVGILIYGYQAAATPFQGGTMCIGGAVQRTPGQASGGSASGTDCTGSFSFDFNAYIALGVDPLLSVVGQQVNVQYWSRDVAASFGSSLTDALQFAICQ